MGEIAEDMVNGRSCELCSCYFKNPEKPNEVYEHGFPVVCRSCWNDLTKKERKMYQLAKVKTF